MNFDQSAGADIMLVMLIVFVIGVLAIIFAAKMARARKQKEMNLYRRRYHPSPSTNESNS